MNSYKRLQSAYQDKGLMDELQDYLLNSTKEKAADLALKGEDTTHIADAKKLLDSFFTNMKADFSVKEKKEYKNNSY